MTFTLTYEEANICCFECPVEQNEMRIYCEDWRKTL